MSLFIGLMSGTSLDGVDGVLVDLASERIGTLAHAHQPFPPALRAELLALNHSGDNELHRAALASNAVTRDSPRDAKLDCAAAACLLVLSAPEYLVQK